MPQIAAISLADGQTTPVTHTFNVGAGQMGEQSPAAWRDTSQGSYNGQKRITALVRRSAGTKSTRVSLKITDPVVDADNMITHQCLFIAEFVMPDTASQQNKNDIFAYAKNLLANSLIAEVVKDTSPAF